VKLPELLPFSVVTLYALTPPTNKKKSRAILRNSGSEVTLLLTFEDETIIPGTPQADASNTTA
jgi:hypothetical protein